MRDAYSALFQQVRLLFEIGAVNRDNGHRPEPALQILRAWRHEWRLKKRYPITVADDGADALEERFVSIGMGVLGRVLVVVYTDRGDNIRVISARAAAAHERAEYEVGLP